MIQLRFEYCVGPSLNEAWILATRFELGQSRFGYGQDPSRTEWWIVRVRDGEIGDSWVTRTPLRGLAAGASGDAYACAARASVSGRLGEESGIWRFIDAARVEIEPRGTPDTTYDELRSLGDGSLVAWTQGPGRRHLALLSDDAIEPLALPPLAETSLVRGASRRHLIACEAGQVATWDGTAWSHAETLDASSVILAAHVRHEREAYVGDLGHLWRGDGSRWSAVAPSESAIVDLADFRGELLVLTSGHGLARFDGGRLHPIPLEPRSKRLFSGRDALLMTSDEAIAETTDLRTTRVIGIDTLGAVIGDRVPLWRTAALEREPSRFIKPLPRIPYAQAKPVRHSFGLCVGDSFDDAFFLSTRSDDVDDFGRDESETVVGRIVDGVIQTVTTDTTVLRRIQRAPSGRVYVAAFSDKGGIWRTPPDGQLVWEPLDVPPMQGIFALDDACVMSWRIWNDGQEFFLFDGTRARAIPSPDGHVSAVHGSAPDWIVAVGHAGLIARWDGHAWRSWGVPIAGALGNVYVVSPDEMYATGPCGLLLEGSQHGWIERAPVEGMGVGVTKWRGQVYVGDPVQGLLRLERDTLEPSPLPVWPTNLHAGTDALLIVERDGFAETRDLEVVRRVGVTDLDAALRDHAPLWR